MEFVTLFLNAEHTASVYEKNHGKQIIPKGLVPPNVLFNIET